MTSDAPSNQALRGRTPHRSAMRRRRILLAAGDGLFLIAVGMLSTLVMHAMHQLGWSFAVTCIVGMAAAMLVQMLMALGVAPLLGSIETMTPSMVIGMFSPMSVCTLHLLGRAPDCDMALLFGAVFGAGLFAFAQVYGAIVRRSLDRAYPADEVKNAQLLGPSGQAV